MFNSSPGVFTEVAEKLGRMLRASPTWLEGTAGKLYPTDCDNGVFLRNAPEETPRPVAVIQPSDQATFRLIAGGAGNWLRPSGSVLLYMAIDVPDELQGDQVRLEWYVLDFFGGVIQEVANQAGVDDLLSITQIQLVTFGPPDETDVPALGSFYFSVWNIAWGDGDQ